MKKTKQKLPYNLYVRYIEDGKKFSVGEYLRAKWNNVCDPFLVNDINAINSLKLNMLTYQATQKRDIALIGYRGSEAATKLQELLNINQ